VKTLSSVVLAVVLLGVNGSRDLGPVPGPSPVELTLMLHERNEPELDRLIALQSDRDSPLYRHFINRVELAERYLPTVTDYARTVAVLRRAGFNIERTSPTRLILGLRGAAVLVDRYFDTRVDRVMTPGDLQPRIALATPARTPAELFGIAGIIGVDDAARVRANLRSSPRRRPPAEEPIPKILFGPDQGYAPYTIARVLDFPVLHGYDGKGVAIGDLVASGPGGETENFSDRGPTSSLAVFLKHFKIVRTGPPTQFYGWGMKVPAAYDDEDSAGDAEAVIAAAPGVTYQVYQFQGGAPGYDGLLVGELDDIVALDKADVVNLAFSACELDTATTAILANEEFKAGTAMGMTFVTAAVGGAYGGAYACSNASYPTVSFPADSPYVLAIGGTDVRVNTVPIIVGTPTGDSQSNGGFSRLFPMPAYQKGIVHATPSGRNVPDVSIPSAIDGVGSSFYWAGIPNLISPGWYGGSAFVDSSYVSGALAELAQMHGGRLGLVNGDLYSAYRTYKYGSTSKSLPSLFTDVTIGCDGTVGSGASGGPYCAASGYDYVTGIGMPDIYALGLLLK
jgi:kumamolisin